MSRKDYVAIAAIINEVLWHEGTDPATVSMLAARMASTFSKDNQRFDYERFFTACFAERKDSGSMVTTA